MQNEEATQHVHILHAEEVLAVKYINSNFMYSSLTLCSYMYIPRNFGPLPENFQLRTMLFECAYTVYAIVHVIYRLTYTAIQYLRINNLHS